MTCDDRCRPKDLTHASRGYRRALVIVVVLNLTMGVAEMFGGLFGKSQALKADALDFLGDGTITLMALIAISHGPRWRARAALLQGVFLTVLGIGVIAAAAYRVIERRLPDSEVMTWLGAAALAVNVASAFVLIPHREGDANVRAVWLFSRNDALGNVAVLIAAGLVFWTETPWPDLVTAGLIGGLFLHSALDIIREARRELHS
ncbi:MAG: cation transporter [Phycisphaeraceae bacterium]|nr:cation transporter [Phycisphaeraceae bacterium]